MTKLIILQFFKFSIVGVFNTLISFVVYLLSLFCGAHYLLANALGFSISVLNAYYWSNKFVFKKGEGEMRNALLTLVKTYIAYAFTGLLLASILLYLYVDRFQISKYIAQLLVLVVTVPLNFIFNKYWSFKTMKMNEDE